MFILNIFFKEKKLEGNITFYIKDETVLFTAHLIFSIVLVAAISPIAAKARALTLGYVLTA